MARVGIVTYAHMPPPVPYVHSQGTGLHACKHTQDTAQCMMTASVILIMPELLHMVMIWHVLDDPISQQSYKDIHKLTIKPDHF